LILSELVKFVEIEVLKMKLNFIKRVKELRDLLPALLLALKRKDTPISAKIVAAATMLYTLSPIDIIPDVTPFMGFLDDLIIFPLMIALATKLIPNDILEETRVEAGDARKSGQVKYWVFGILLYFLSMLIIGWVLSKIFVQS